MTTILQNLIFALIALQTALAAGSTYPVLLPKSLTAAEILQNYPILEHIAACESTGNPNGTPRQFNTNGSPLWGNDAKTGKPIMRDVGIFQINTWAHADELKKLGLDWWWARLMIMQTML